MIVAIGKENSFSVISSIINVINTPIFHEIKIIQITFTGTTTLSRGTSKLISLFQVVIAMEFWLLIAFAFTAFNTGLIWVIQVVHYPSFLHIDAARYETFQKFHMKGITFIVLPSMLAELVSSGLLLLYWTQLPSTALYVVAVVLLGLIWLHTALLASPIHVKLASAYERENIRKLIRVNWYRTVLWTARAVMMGYLLWLVL